MEVIPQNCLLNYKTDTLEYLRNQYGFDTLKRVNDAINILEEWIAKQEHFEKKSFDRGFLERMLIYNKGSVEKCKKKLDRQCTLRTLIPEFFSTEKIDKKSIFAYYSDTILRQMTPDYGRVHFFKCVGNKFTTENLTNYAKYFVLIYKYIQMKDYCNHVTAVADYSQTNFLEYTTTFDIPMIRKSVEIAFLGLSMRIKEMHVISNSKAFEIWFSLLKPMMGEKLSKRMHLHSSIDSIYKYIPKEMFPQEYGGDDKPLSKSREDLYNELYSEEFTEYRNEMNKACTNEALRRKDKFNEEYLGIPGSFRTLTVD